MARKALVIGLGTTGGEVCNRLIKRLMWEHGSLDRTPWLRFLVLETAGAASATQQDTANDASVRSTHDGRTEAEKTGNFRYIPVQQNAQLKDVITHPDRWKAQIDPTSWLNPEFLTFLANLRGPGAGNIRQFGRLATLFPAHLNAFQEDVRRRLIELSALTTASASEAFGVPLNFDQSRVDLFVCGTLAGGTGSGSFLDIPHLLRENSAFRNGMQIIALLAGYPDNGGTNEYGSNTYHALREYHHMATPGTEYKALINGREIHSDSQPYDEFHLICPANDKRDEVTRMVSSVADYVYLRAFSPDADTVMLQREADYGSGYSTASKLGQQQNQATFGISGIEYPAQRYIETLQLKLAKNAFSRWLSDRADDPPTYGDDLKRAVRQSLAERGLVDRAGKSALMIASSTPASPNAVPVAADLRQAINTLLSDQARQSQGDLQRLREARSQADYALGQGDTGSPAPGLPRDCVKQRISENQARVRAESRTALANELRKTLTDLTYNLSGLHYAREYVQEAQRLIGEEREKLEQRDPATGAYTLLTQRDSLRNQLTTVEDELQAVRRDPFLAILGGKGWATSRVLGEWSEAAQDYYASSTAIQEQTAMLDIYAQLSEDLSVYAQRLSASAYLTEYARAFQREIEDSLEQQRNRAEDTNYEILDPVTEESLTREYEAAFLDPNNPQNRGVRDRRENEAMKNLIEALAPLIERLFTPEAPQSGYSRNVPTQFQPGKLDVEPEEWKELLRRGREQFRAIEDRHILDLLAGLPRREAEDHVAQMIARSAPMLHLDLSDTTRFEDLPMKRAGFLFFNRQSQENTNPQPKEVRLFTGFLRAYDADGLRHHETEEIHRISIIREQTAFPLSIVRGMIGDSGAYVRYAAQAPPRPTYYSRSDIKYWFPLEPVPEADEIVTLFLVMVGIKELDTQAYPIQLDSPNFANPIQFPNNLQHIRIQFSGNSQERSTARIEMTNRIFNFRQTKGNDELVLCLNDFVKRVSEYAFFKVAGAPLDTQGAKSWIIPYLRKDTHLWRVWTDLPGNGIVAFNPEILKHEAGTIMEVLNAKGERENQPITVAGYHCDCGFRFGPSADDVTKAKRCQKCGELYVYG